MSARNKKFIGGHDSTYLESHPALRRWREGEGARAQGSSLRADVATGDPVFFKLKRKGKNFTL